MATTTRQARGLGLLFAVNSDRLFFAGMILLCLALSGALGAAVS